MARHLRPATDRSAPGRHLATVLLALVLGATACTDDGEPASAPTTSSTPPSSGTSTAGDDGAAPVERPDGLVLAASLRTVDSCDALLGELKAEALERVGPYGLDGGGVGVPEPLMEGARATADAEESAAATDGSGAPGAQGGDQAGGYSTTNVQEEGVDEADAVKTDGRRLVVVSGPTVRVVDVTGPEPVLTATIELPQDVFGGDLFLDGDRALLLSSAWVAVPAEGDAARSGMMPAGTPASRVTELDLAGGRVVRSLEVEGAYLSARAVDGTVRVVVSNAEPTLPFLYPANPGAEEAAAEANRRVIEASTIEDWLPAYRWLDGAGAPTGEGGALVPCERLHLPAEFAGFGTLSVLSFDVAQPTTDQAVSVLTDGQIVYASTDRLVVATPRWIDPRIFSSGDDAAIREATEDHSTALHTFDITEPAARYVASGRIEGRVLDQFSLDEHEGLVRVATTDGQMWGDTPDSESAIVVLREAGDRLEQVGGVGGLGPGEQIQSVRFGPDVAYVVTFRQIDPLYVVDLSDPTSPRVAGELKIPGFSSYLHPISDTLVVGVGQDATDEGRVTGAQLSVFDVSDPTAPRRVGQLGLGQDSYSLAGDDHRAFLWWVPGRLAVLPVSRWAWQEGTRTQEQTEVAVVVHIDDAGQPTEVGRISHPAAEQCADGPRPMPVEGEGEAAAEIAPPQDCWAWQPPISRSVVVGDVLYTVSDGGVLATALDGLTSRGFAPFPR